MSTALTTLTRTLATKLDMGDGADLIDTLKATAFKGQVSDAQMTALLVVANQYMLNPWTKEIYAFPDKNNGIVPVVGVDGWSRIINTHQQFDGIEFEQNDEACTCIIYRKDRTRPIKVTEWMAECRRGTGPWQTHPKRMLRHKAMIQCARLAFGYGGIYDQDEAERIVEAQPATKQMGMVEVVEPAAPPTWPEDSFKARLPKWQAAVNTGSDVEEIVKFARSKGALTAEQEAAIRALKPQEQQQSPNFDQVAHQLRSAMDADALNVAADLIGSITDPAQQAELNAIYETRMDEMSA
ncbi:phage recombination protein Bet [Acidovorax sp. K2F]|uniref:phage recombination protein Bet n=1 Tax=Acidovorax sp. K2F TaxID=2978125 RepID=UPI0021B0A2E9|nr:phage recombination protein Bet [Acidovorax sp. K2F]MCT6719470.1 phage recombination protein Bet [Acidovorax sp. K2F]